jgi:hypothetical protein
LILPISLTVSRKIRRQANGHAELAIAFENRCGDSTAHRGLNNRVHIPSVKTISCRFGAIDLDVQVWLAEDMEDSEIFDSPDSLHLFHDLRRQRLVGRQIRSDDLDRIRAFDSRKRLLDIVLDVLREIEVNSWQFFRKLILKLFGELVLPAIHRTA